MPSLQEAGIGFLEGYHTSLEFQNTIWGWLALKPEDKEVLLHQLKEKMAKAEVFIDLVTVKE